MATQRSVATLWSVVTMRMRSSLCAVVMLLTACHSGEDGSHVESTKPPFATVVEAGTHFNNRYRALASEYDELRRARIEAYALRDSASRHNALLRNDAACLAFERELRATDSAWQATARWYLMQRNGSFTEFCTARGIDSTAVIAKLTR